MQPGDDLPLGERVNRSMNLLLLVASVLAFPTIIFLHRDIGRRFAGPQAMLALVILFFWPLLDPHASPFPLLWFLGAVLLMCVVSRVQGLRRKGLPGGDPIYRHYDGTPRLMRLFFCQDELRFKRFQEPVIVFFAGMMAGVLSPLLAMFLMASAVALFITVNANTFAHRERAEAMRDRMHEQQVLSERFRSLGGK